MKFIQKITVFLLAFVFLTSLVFSSNLAVSAAPAVSIKIPFENGTQLLITQSCIDGFSPKTCSHSNFTGKQYSVDFDCYVKSYNILAATDGVVIESGTFVGWGNYVKIKLPDGRVSLYGHLRDKPTVSGAIKQGQVIGNCGSTGNSTGRHLHFEIRPSETIFSTIPIYFDECVGNSNCVLGQLADMRKYTSKNSAPSGPVSVPCNSLYSQVYFVGQTGDAVSAVQNCLIKSKLLNIPSPTGYFGNLTNGALGCRALISGNYTIGQTGNSITSLQKCLIDLGYLKIAAPTGYLGNLTNAAMGIAKNLIIN